MSLEINSSTPLIVPQPPAASQHTNAADQKPVREHEAKHQQQEIRESRAPDFSKVFDNMFAGTKHANGHFKNAFKHLLHSLEKVFAEAPKVDRQTGEEEMHHGGLKRVGKDLTRLFKGLGIPKELAKQFSTEMTAAIKGGDVEKVDLSLSVTKTFNLEVQQLQQGYQVNGDGSMVTTSISNNLQLSAVQVRSLDISINLNTGDFTMTRSRFDAFSMNSFSSAAVLSSEDYPVVDEIPAGTDGTATETQSTDPGVAATAQPGEAEVAEAGPGTEAVGSTEGPVEPTKDFDALVRTNSQLLQISRIVQQSAVMRLQPNAEVAMGDNKDDNEASAGLDVLQGMFSRVEEITRTANSLFESLVQINNLRIDKEDGEDHLRFTFEALSPIGMSVTNEEGQGRTLYPRPDGSLAKVVEDPIRVSA